MGVEEKGAQVLKDCLFPSLDYPPGYFPPDLSKKLGMQPDLTVVSSSGGTGGGGGGTMNPMGQTLCYEYTYAGSGITNKDNPPLTPGDTQFLNQSDGFMSWTPFPVL